MEGVDSSLPLGEPWALPCLNAVEEGLRRAATTDDPDITAAALHLIAAGGKRVRPLISLATACGLGAVEPDPNDPVIRGAVAVELVHLASLYHDDVMDEALERRGVRSANARFGNLVAVVTGDFLLARAAGIAARLGQEVASLLADTLAAMCEGQILEVADAHRLGRTRERYLAAIRGKTASLMGAAARIPAIVLGLSRDVQDSLSVVGTTLGMLFQLRDDVLDLVATRDQLGKEPGQDLLEGVYTLPVIVALEDPTIGPALADALAHADDPDQRSHAVSRIRRAGGITTTIATMRELEAGLLDALQAIGMARSSWLARLADGLISSTVGVALGQEAESALA